MSCNSLLGTPRQYLTSGVTLAVWCLLLAGCGSAPYAKVGVGYQADPNKIHGYHYWPHDLACAEFLGAVGLEWEDGWLLELAHESCIDPGSNEIPDNDVTLIKKFGGK